jgi:hypothetical protein
MEEPSKELCEAAKRYRRAVNELETARVALARLIRSDAARGVRQVDLVRVTDYTREQVRRITRG